MILKDILYVLLVIFLASFFYWLIQVIIELKRRNFVGNFFENLNKKYEQRKIEKEAEELLQGITEKKNFIDKIDHVIECSGIKKLIPQLTSEKLLIATVFAALVISTFVNSMFDSWILTLAAFICVMAGVFFILKIMGKRTFENIDKQILTYTNTLKNLSTTNTDIVTIFEKSLSYVNEPLKQHIEQFVYECKKGIPLVEAFKDLEDNIENTRFKQLLRNLAVASKHDANYREILNSSRIIFKHYFAEKERRKVICREGRAGIVLILAIGIVVFKLLESFIGGNILGKLKYTFGGNILLAYMLAVSLYAIYKFITLDRLNY